MSIFTLVTTFLSGIFFGIGLLNYKLGYDNRKILKDINLKFKEILDNISNGECVFKNRSGDIVIIGSNIKDIGDVDLIYTMNDLNLGIFKNGQCIYVSDSVDKNVISDIIDNINLRYNKEINDIVDILGLKLYRKEFERIVKVDFNRIKDQFETSDDSEISKIKSENDSRFDLDDILDKINFSGLSSLTIEEKEFLNSYKNGN